ncbi:hypothetical protein M0811_04809 [Anaeramoeba ignava]|uniref:Saposin B-type domain-containing protein n=1 Tax=Anaeramoeba ignava TaxID=1746090 RepID=A0A9Q0LTY3_ANAIG|nr:hypothetical protein M0811_04809 [Anaeramoeba ignava]|eukprot:Anaeramoba_ignava/a227490_645.p1 GENE.a227490_645~~a227490_645.p1  ORF type:complete len:102 (+),score=38.07 a227490_645:52-357(+)
MKFFFFALLLVLFVVVSSEKQNVDAIPCTICEIMMEIVDKIIGDKRTEDEIITALEKVCGMLPSQYVDECNLLVSQYGPDLIQWFLDDVTPQQICQYLGLC